MFPVPIIQARRRFLTTLSLAGAAGLVRAPRVLAAEGLLETTTLRIANRHSLCNAPQHVAEELLRPEGFTEIRYVDTRPADTAGTIAGGKVDFSMAHASYWIPAIDTGEPVILLAGIHVGCFELFAREGIHSVGDLKEKSVGVEALGGSTHVFLAATAAHVGLDPARVALPVKLAMFVYLFVLLANQTDPNFAPSAVLSFPGKSGWNWVIFVAWFNAAAAGWLTMITDSADFCRYSRSRADMWIGTLSASAIGTMISGSLGAYAAAATLGKTANPFVIIAGISASWVTLFLILVFIALDNWTINVLNLYTGGLSIANIFERLGRFWTTLIASVVGIALSAIPDVLNSYLTYATLLGNFFSPIAGVLVFDYLILKRTRLDVPALFTLDGRYRYWGGFNLVAVVWTVLGFFFYMFAVPATWIPTVVTIAFTGIGYTLTAMAVARRSKIMALAGAPSNALPVPAE